jgi:thiamine biosynthesis lipoprotein
MQRQPSTIRRDFLRGKGLASAIAELIEPLHTTTLTDSARVCRSQADQSLITATRRAMACQFQIALPATQPRAIETASAALDLIDELEGQMTVYCETSEVSRINALAAFAPVCVESRLFELFELAARVTAETDGAFDIAAGAIVKAWGFFRGPKCVPDPNELARAMECVGSHHVALHSGSRTIAFDRPGVELNLGAIGKGYALDRAREVIESRSDAPSALLHGGQSSILAIGSFDDEASSAKGWLVAIGHPQRQGDPIAKLRLRDCALGTSGATIQFFEASGRRWGHILDPRTGWPVAGQTCVSVIAPSAALADALSTAFFILGPDRAREYCDLHPDVGAVLVSLDDARADVSVVGCACDLQES